MCFRSQIEKSWEFFKWQNIISWKDCLWIVQSLPVNWVVVNSDKGVGDRNVYFSFRSLVWNIFVSDQIVHYVPFGCVDCSAFQTCMLIQRHSKSLCWTSALFSKKAISSISCPLGHTSFLLSKRFYMHSEYIRWICQITHR